MVRKRQKRAQMAVASKTRSITWGKKWQNLCNVLRSMKFKFLSLSSFKRREKSLREKKRRKSRLQSPRDPFSKEPFSLILPLAHIFLVAQVESQNKDVIKGKPLKVARNNLVPFKRVFTLTGPFFKMEQKNLLFSLRNTLCKNNLKKSQILEMMCYSRLFESVCKNASEWENQKLLNFDFTLTLCEFLENFQTCA